MKPATSVTVMLLGLFAVAHIVCVALGVDVTVRGVAVPMWASVVAALFFATLAGAVRREHRRAS